MSFSQVPASIVAVVTTHDSGKSLNNLLQPPVSSFMNLKSSFALDMTGVGGCDGGGGKRYSNAMSRLFEERRISC